MAHDPAEHKRTREGAYISLCSCGEQVPHAEWAYHKYGSDSAKAKTINTIRLTLDGELANFDQDYDLYRVSAKSALDLAEKVAKVLYNG